MDVNHGSTKRSVESVNLTELQFLHLFNKNNRHCYSEPWWRFGGEGLVAWPIHVVYGCWAQRGTHQGEVPTFFPSDPPIFLSASLWASGAHARVLVPGRWNATKMKFCKTAKLSSLKFSHLKFHTQSLGAVHLIQFSSVPQTRTPRPWTWHRAGLGMQNSHLRMLTFRSWHKGEIFKWTVWNLVPLSATEKCVRSPTGHRETVAEIRPLYAGAGLNLGDRVLGEVERNSFARQRGPQRANPSRLCPSLEGVVRCLIVFKEQGVVSSWTFFWLVGGEVIGSRHHQPSGPNWSGVYVLVGSMQLTSPTW